MKEFKGSPWLDWEGYPKSWRHFHMGMAHLHRDRARQKIDLCNTIRVAQSSKQSDYDDWMLKQKRAADWD